MEASAERKPLKLWHGIALLAVVLLLMVFVFSFAQLHWGLWGMVVTELSFALLAILAVFVFRADIKTVFRFKRLRVRHLLGSIVLWLGAWLVTIGASLGMMMVFPDMYEATRAINDFLKTGGVPLQIVSVAVLPGICEELLHRGFIFNSSAGIRHKWLRLLYMGVMFGIFHLDLYRFLLTMLLGVALTFIMLRTENLFYPMLCHFLNNLISVSMPGGGEMQPSDFAALMEMVNFGQVAFIMLLGVGPIIAGCYMLKQSAQAGTSSK